MPTTLHYFKWHITLIKLCFKIHSGTSKSYMREIFGHSILNAGSFEIKDKGPQLGSKQKVKQSVQTCLQFARKWGFTKWRLHC